MLKSRKNFSNKFISFIPGTDPFSSLLVKTFKEKYELIGLGHDYQLFVQGSVKPEQTLPPPSG